MALLTAAYTVVWANGTGFVSDITQFVQRVSGGSETSSNADNPLAFGDNAESRCTITVYDIILAGANVTGWTVRVTFSINGIARSAFVGIIQSQREQSAADTVELDCAGASEIIRITKSYSPAFSLRPVATKTTASSVENPASPGYVAGVMNFCLWDAGGRPYEQAGSYPGVAFYYSLDQAILAPAWSWLAGEDGWAEMQKLAQAAGGQLYQDTFGVVRYRQPLNIVANTPTYTFTNDVYASAERSRSRNQLITKAIVSFIPRAARPLQEVANDATPRLIGGGDIVTYTIEPQWPLKSLETTIGLRDTKDMTGGEQLLPGALVITDMGGNAVAQGGSGYTHGIDCTAQQVKITITSTVPRPIVLWRIILRGEPITAGEAGNVTAGTGSAESQVNDNPYIQTQAHATRLANLILTFYASTRSLITLNDCPYDPLRYVGEVVRVTVARWGVTTASHVIVGIDHDETGAKSSYRLADVAGLPASDSYFQVGGTVYASNAKVGY